MSAFSDYLEAAILNHTLRGNVSGTSYAQPANVYVALFTAATTDTVTSGGAGQNEVANAGSYARMPVTFALPSSGQCQNTADIIFPTASAGWGTVSHVAIFDALTYGTGNCLYHGALATSKTINSGDTFRFLAGQLVVGLD